MLLALIQGLRNNLAFALVGGSKVALGSAYKPFLEGPGHPGYTWLLLAPPGPPGYSRCDLRVILTLLAPIFFRQSWLSWLLLVLPGSSWPLGLLLATPVMNFESP